MMSCTSWVGPDPQFTCELGRPSVGWLVVPFRDVSSHKVLWSCTSDALHVGLICPSHFIECLTLNFRTRYRRVVIARSSCCMGLFVILTSLVVVLFLVTGSKFHIHIWVWSKRRLRTDSVLGGEREMFFVSKILLRRPHLIITITILLFTSYTCSAFAGKTDPRYVNW